MSSAARLVAVGLMLATAGCAPRAAVPSPSRGVAPNAAAGASVAFVDVNVVPMDTERVLTHQTVVITHERIVALGPVDDVRVPAGAQRVDGRGKYLIPGLGDMHTHLGYSGTAHAERHLLLLLAAGVTTVRNMDWYPNATFRTGRQELANTTPLDGPALLRLKARVASGELLGPRIYTSAPWRTDSTKSVDDNVAAYKAAGYDHLKWYLEDSIMTDSLAAAAHRVGIPLVGHGMESVSRGLARTLALGFTSIEHLVPYTNDSTLPAQVAATVRAGVWNCLCPLFDAGTYPSRLEMRYGVRELRLLKGTEPDSATVAMLTTAPAAPAVQAQAQAQAAGGFRDYLVEAKALHDGGAQLLLGTDMPAWGILPTMLHRSMQTAVRIGFTPYETLALVTRNVAAYFGTRDSTGTIAMGRRADLVLLTGNPLVNIRHVSDIAGVMAAGRWLSQAELARRLDASYPGRPNVGR